jgi:hypothetical protein
MGSPYLNSGEAIVLTTHRVSVDAVAYDVMLTTERIVLIDNRNARFDPKIIMLSSVLSVQGGKTPAQDPVITLLFRMVEEGSARPPLNLVFTQNRHEDRKPERDDWVRSLIQLSIARQENGDATEAPVIPELRGETGLRPAVRHGNAPEMVRPLSNVVERRKEPAPVTVIPEEVDLGGGIPAHAAVVMPARAEHSVEPQEPVADLPPLHGTPFPVPTPHARVIIPQIIEELLPVKTAAPAPPAGEEPVPVAGFDEEALFRAIPTAVRSMTVTEERTSPPPVMETRTAPDEEAVTPDAGMQKTIPEIIRALHTGAAEPDTTVPPAAVAPEPVPEPVQEAPEEGSDGIPESHVSLTIPGNVLQEPAGHGEPEPIFRRESAAADAPPVRHPIPPAREIRPLRTTLAYAAVLLLIIALVAAGAVLLLPPGSGPADNPATPAPTVVPATTGSPATIPPTTVPPVTPRTTPLVTPAAAAAVPQEGVWVRVNSTANYFGTVGNPELMQKVSGTGDHFYKVLKNDRPVQVSVQKQDNSGALLAVGIYRNGTLISSRSVTSPMGAVDLLIDPLTARAPGITENDTLPEHAANPSGLENY